MKYIVEIEGERVTYKDYLNINNTFNIELKKYKSTEKDNKFENAYFKFIFDIEKDHISKLIEYIEENISFDNLNIKLIE